MRATLDRSPNTRTEKTEEGREARMALERWESEGGALRPIADAVGAG